MNLGFLKKKKVANIKDLHDHGINPWHDWLISLGACLFIILLGLSISLFLLFSDYGSDSPQTNPDQNNSTLIDTHRLDSAIEYINSRNQ